MVGGKCILHIFCPWRFANLVRQTDLVFMRGKYIPFQHCSVFVYHKSSLIKKTLKKRISLVKWIWEMNTLRVAMYILLIRYLRCSSLFFCGEHKVFITYGFYLLSFSAIILLHLGLHKGFRPLIFSLTIVTKFASLLSLTVLKYLFKSIPGLQILST